MKHQHPMSRAWRLASRTAGGAVAGLVVVSGSLALAGEDLTAGALGGFAGGGAVLGAVLQLLNEREDAR